MRLIGIVALAVAALAQEDFSGLKPDIAYLPEHVVHFNQTMKSGEFHPAAMDAAIAKEGTFLLWDVLVTPEKGAARTQLFFHHDTVLSDGDVDAATLKIWSELDGAVQMLNAHTIRQWGFKSAMFNGDTVHVQLLASTDAGVVSAAIVGALVGESDMGPEENTLCTARDRRERSRGREEFRYVAGGYCSGGLITIRGGSGLADGCLLTAGHCTGVGRVEFNVPDSSNNGQVVHPGPEHQYPVDSTSVQQANSGVGNDWKYMGAFPNSNTGLTALEAQEDSHPFQLTPTESPPQPFHHFGHGSTSPRNNLNLVNKGTPGGGTGSRTQNTMRYRFDTTGGDSGSAVTDNNGIYVAVHTHGGCSPNNPNSANIGTWIGRPQIQTAVRNPRGVCNAKILEATKTQYRYGVHFRGAVNAFEGPKITF